MSKAAVKSVPVVVSLSISHDDSGKETYHAKYKSGHVRKLTKVEFGRLAETGLLKVNVTSTSEIVKVSSKVVGKKTTYSARMADGSEMVISKQLYDQLVGSQSGPSSSGSSKRSSPKRAKPASPKRSSPGSPKPKKSALKKGPRSPSRKGRTISWGTDRLHAIPRLASYAQDE